MLKKIIILAAAGLLSFAGAFAFSWFTSPKEPDPNNIIAKEQSNSMQEFNPSIPQPPGRSLLSTEEQMKRSLSQEQLRALIEEVRSKIEHYNTKLQDLKVQEERIKIAHDTLTKDIKGLEDLRVELASGIASLKKQKEELEKSRIEITKAEERNLTTLAAAYDKMDPTSASKILASMSQTKNGNYNDAVKILYFMGDRSKANLLAELAMSEPSIAAYFCQKLKQIDEEK